MHTRFPLSVLLPLLLATAGPARAQLPVIDGPLPAEVEAHALAFVNAPEVLRLPAGTRIPVTTRIAGGVAVLGGSLQLGGEIDGELVVVNGDLDLLPGARVRGPILVLGGTVRGADVADLGAEVRVYGYPLRYRIRAGRIELEPDEGRPPGFMALDLGFGQARFTLRAGPQYNRVEGLPVRVGPLIRTSGANPLTLEAFGIWRSVSGLNLESERLGYSFRLEQALGGRGMASVGASAYSDVATVEDVGLTNAEASLSTFLLRRDPRDHYERKGWSAFLALRARQIPVGATFAYREEEHETPPLRDPWTLRSTENPWRPLTLAAEGTIRSVEAALRWDSSDDPMLPSDGWRVDLTARRQVGGELRLPPSAPGPLPSEGSPPLEEASALPFATLATLDIRRYARVGPSSRLILRAVAGGTITGEPLPPQFQRALGGEGTLPGHPRFALDCGARETLRAAARGEGEEAMQLFHPAYGCDRSVLFQAEFQGFLPLSWNPVPAEWEDSELSAVFDLHPVWAVFFNAGQGWSRGGLGIDVARPDAPTRADVGVGLFLGPLGLYWAYPLNQKDQGVNFFVRLQQRF